MAELVTPPLLLASPLPYERIAPALWLRAVVRLRRLGLTALILRPRWAAHAPRPGQVDLEGATDPRLNLLGVLALARELGMQAVLDLGGLASPPAWVVGLDAAAAPDLRRPAVAQAARALADTFADLLRSFVAPGGPLVGALLPAGLALAETVHGWMREGGLALPRIEQPLPLAQALGWRGTLAQLQWDDALGTCRADGSLRPAAWQVRPSLQLLAASAGAHASAALPASNDLRQAWADQPDVSVEVRHAGAEVLLAFQSRRAETYSGMLTYRGVDDSLLHLHVVLGPQRGGLALLRDEEVVGVAFSGDASEGTWLARSLRSSVTFSGGPGGSIPCGRGLLLAAGQSGRFQVRRQDGWQGLRAFRLTLRGALLAAGHKVEASHLIVPYVAEDALGVTDFYLVAEPDTPLPEPAQGYLRTTLALRALQLSAAAQADGGVAQLAEAAAALAQRGAAALSPASYSEAWEATEPAAQLARSRALGAAGSIDEDDL